MTAEKSGVWAAILEYPDDQSPVAKRNRTIVKGSASRPVLMLSRSLIDAMARMFQTYTPTAQIM